MRVLSYDQAAREAALTSAFCRAEQVTVMREHGFGDIIVRGQRGERLRITEDEIFRLTDSLGSNDDKVRYLLAFIKVGLEVARAHPELGAA